MKLSELHWCKAGGRGESSPIWLSVTRKMKAIDLPHNILAPGIRELYGIKIIWSDLLIHMLGAKMTSTGSLCMQNVATTF